MELRHCDEFFLFKQKTAYEMRISDWSSDVCSSDLPMRPAKYFSVPHLRRVSIVDVVTDDDAPDWDVFLQGPGNTDKDLRVESAELLIRLAGDESCVAVPLGRDSVNDELGIASGRERVCQYV